MVDVIEAAESLLVYAIVAAIIIQSLLTWFAPMGVGKLSALLYDIAYPVIAPIRRVIPPFGMIDLSPMIAILLLYFLIGPLLLGITRALAGQ